MPSFKYLIVGGGMAADAAVQGIREVDQSGTIGLVSAESYKPYNRPPLSKALWKGDNVDIIWRHATDSGVALCLGRRVVALDPEAKTVTDDAGDSYGYEKLLIATGGSPRDLKAWSDRIFYYRTFEDYQNLREVARVARHFVVIGGGFIGSEMAAALRMNGRDVEMIIPENGIGARVFPANLSAFLVDYFKEKGVTIRLDEGVTALEPKGNHVTVRTRSGRDLTADAVIAGLGIIPNTDFAERAGITVNNGVVVNRTLETNIPGIYAAGDVANFPYFSLGEQFR